MTEDADFASAIPRDETRVITIYCPDCGWMKTIEEQGPADEEHAPELHLADYWAEGDIRRHVGEMDALKNEIHRPLILSDQGWSGFRRFEPDVGEVGEFVD